MNKLQLVKLGVNGPPVGVQGFGCMGMSEFYGASDEREAIATLHAAIDRGATLIDTADMYGRGANEELVGHALHSRRSEIVLATKFGIERPPGNDAVFAINNRPDYILRAADASLARLGVDLIDLYYMHRRDRSVPLADSIGAMASLVKAGKVRHLGLSEVSGDELQEAHAIHPITALQSEWSVFSREIEQGPVQAAAKLGVAVVAFSPLGRGQLTDTRYAQGAADPRDIRNRYPRFSTAHAEENERILQSMRALAESRGLTTAQLALAWLQHRSQVHRLTVVPIPGTRRLSRLEENLKAASVELDVEALTALEPLAGIVAGARMR